MDVSKPQKARNLKSQNPEAKIRSLNWHMKEKLSTGKQAIAWQHAACTHSTPSARCCSATTRCVSGSPPGVSHHTENSLNSPQTQLRLSGNDCGGRTDRCAHSMVKTAVLQFFHRTLWLFKYIYRNIYVYVLYICIRMSYKYFSAVQWTPKKSVSRCLCLQFSYTFNNLQKKCPLDIRNSLSWRYSDPLQ